ncbi:MAG: hypothetical protein M3063_17150 [Actinomycetota bacterium]|nr:hypothetical protein [Actinomycetota bacterium]
MRFADGRPGDECQIDFGRTGSLHDPTTDRIRAAHSLIFTACLSRRCSAGVDSAWAIPYSQPLGA